MFWNWDIQKVRKRWFYSALNSRFCKPWHQANRWELSRAGRRVHESDILVFLPSLYHVWKIRLHYITVMSQIGHRFFREQLRVKLSCYATKIGRDSQLFNCNQQRSNCNDSSLSCTKVLVNYALEQDFIAKEKCHQAKKLDNIFVLYTQKIKLRTFETGFPLSGFVSEE